MTNQIHVTLQDQANPYLQNKPVFPCRKEPTSTANESRPHSVIQDIDWPGSKNQNPNWHPPLQTTTNHTKILLQNYAMWHNSLLSLRWQWNSGADQAFSCRTGLYDPCSSDVRITWRPVEAIMQLHTWPGSPPSRLPPPPPPIGIRHFRPCLALGCSSGRMCRYLYVQARSNFLGPEQPWRTCRST